MARLNAEQREDIGAALLEYGARLTDDDHIAKGDKVMSVRLEVKSGRLRVEGGGKLLASYPVSRSGSGISDFVKKFWFWEKTPKSPAQIKREIDEALGRR